MESSPLIATWPSIASTFSIASHERTRINNKSLPPDKSLTNEGNCPFSLDQRRTDYIGGRGNLSIIRGSET